MGRVGRSRDDLATLMQSLKLNPAHEEKMGTNNHTHGDICLFSFLSRYRMLTVPLGFIGIKKHGMLVFVHPSFLRIIDLHDDF